MGNNTSKGEKHGKISIMIVTKNIPVTADMMQCTHDNVR